MLERLTVRNFKSLRDVTVRLPRLSILFGPNAAGKSNLLDAIKALSWLGNARTVFHALAGPVPVRGHSFEAFSFAAEGLPALLKRGTARFMLDADLTIGKAHYRYRIEPQIDFKSGQLSVADEYLGQLTATAPPKGAAANSPGTRFPLAFPFLEPPTERKYCASRRLGTTRKGS